MFISAFIKISHRHVEITDKCPSNDSSKAVMFPNIRNIFLSKSVSHILLASLNL